MTVYLCFIYVFCINGLFQELDEMARKAVESHLMECGATLQSARFQSECGIL